VNRRTLLVTIGWLGAAVLAVLVGLGAISVIGNGLTAPETRPLSAAEVADELARQVAVSPSASAGAGDRPVESPSPSSSATAVARTLPTRAGTVVGRCTGGRPEVLSMSPHQGYELHDQDRGPQEDDADGEFRSQSDGHDRVKFEIVCRGGVPVLVEDRED
jgi:hypothetical protein